MATPDASASIAATRRILRVMASSFQLGSFGRRGLWGKETRSRTVSDSLCRSGAVSSQTRCRIHGPRHLWHRRAGRQRARDRCDVVPRSPDDQAAIAGPSRGRAPSRGEALLRNARGRGCRAALLGAEGSSWIGSSASAVPGSSLIAPGPDGRSSGLSFSDGAPGERRPYACSLRNWVHVGPIRRGAGPSPPSRSTVAMVVAETSIPSFRNSPRILR